MTNTKFSGALAATCAYLLIWAVRSVFVALALSFWPEPGASAWDVLWCAVLVVLAARVVAYKLDGFDGDEGDDDVDDG